MNSLLISTSIVLSLLYVVAAAPEDLDALQTRELKLEQDEKPYEYEEYPSVETKEGGYGHYESYAPMPFAFGYHVKDDYYNNFGHETKSDGHVRTGRYHVDLPDGRTQIVNYKADHYGYVADVQYKGDAKYDDYQPSYKSDDAAAKADDYVENDKEDEEATYTDE